MIALIIILVYLLASFGSYKFIISKWSHPLWEKIMLSLSWICILPLYGIRKFQETFWKREEY